jgi:tetratricopeptide (TPR) repeat protein
MTAAQSVVEEIVPVFSPPALTVVGGTHSEEARLHGRIVEAERLLDVNRHDEAVASLEGTWHETKLEPALALRHLLVVSWAEMYAGHLGVAAELLDRAETLACLPRFDASERAELLFRRGCLALKGANVAEASSLFTRALETNERAPLPSLRLHARAYEWRARCHVLRRDLEAAEHDAERSVRAAAEAGDELLRAHALLQAGIVAERRGQWNLARCSTEQALHIYRAHDDLLATARTLNNLGCMLFLLGEVAEAERSLAEAAVTATAAGSEPDVAQASSSLAQVYVRTGRTREGRERAAAAAALLEGRTDFLDELGNAQLVVAKALAAEGDVEECEVWLTRAEATFTSLGSASHLAAAWIERGDLARSVGDLETAAALYRHSAESLQDFHF